MALFECEGSTPKKYNRVVVSYIVKICYTYNISKLGLSLLEGRKNLFRG